MHDKYTVILSNIPDSFIQAGTFRMARLESCYDHKVAHKESNKANRCLVRNSHFNAPGLSKAICG